MQAFKYKDEKPWECFTLSWSGFEIPLVIINTNTCQNIIL